MSLFKKIGSAVKKVATGPARIFINPASRGAVQVLSGNSKQLGSDLITGVSRAAAVIPGGSAGKSVASGFLSSTKLGLNQDIARSIGIGTSKATSFINMFGTKAQQKVLGSPIKTKNKVQASADGSNSSMALNSGSNMIFIAAGLIALIAFLLRKK